MMTPERARALVGHLNLPTDCDCDNEDCVRCAHYPTFVDNAEKELRKLAPDLLTAYLAAVDEVDRLMGLLIEAADDLTTYADQDYPPETCAQYPDTARRHFRDLELVRRIETALMEPKP